MKNSIIVLLISGAVSFSCTNATSNEDEERISLPLKVGNSWTYDVTITNYQNDPITEAVQPDIMFTVLSDTVVDGIHWYYIASDNRHMNEHKAGYYSNQEKGIYFYRSIESSFEIENFTEVFTVGEIVNKSKPSGTNETNKPPFLHNPDNEVPERLVKTPKVIASVTYKGENFDESFNVNTQNYIWNYYQQTSGTRVYTFNPFDMHYSVSNELGFIIFESAYASLKGSTEEDPRLQLFSIYRFELTEFNEASGSSSP